MKKICENCVHLAIWVKNGNTSICYRTKPPAEDWLDYVIIDFEEHCKHFKGKKEKNDESK